jgi:hypothetical protein
MPVKKRVSPWLVEHPSAANTVTPR